MIWLCFIDLIFKKPVHAVFYSGNVETMKAASTFFLLKNWTYLKTIILRTVDGSKNETNVAVSNSTLEKTNLTSLPNDDPNPDKNDLIKISTEEIPTTLEIANQTSVANDDQNQDEITTDSNY